jgi:3-oxoacyl-[acyl-carrier-protein] synthase III
LALEGLDPADIAVVFPPYLSPAALDELAASIGIPRSRFVDLAVDTDPFTSSLPYGLEQARQHGLARPGDIALIVTVGSGIQVGCTTYRF